MYRARLLWLAAEYHQKTGRPLQECFVPVLYGFEPKYYFFLGLKSHDPSDYITDHWPIREANGETDIVLNDKLAIYRLFSDFSEHFPDLYGTIHNGRYLSADGGESSSLRDAVDTYTTVIAKPVTGCEGRGVYKISSADQYTINGEPVSITDVEKLQATLEEDYIVTECIGQHKYASTIAPGSVNTIRLLTAIDPDTGESTVVRGIHRFGTRESAPTDNWENGGIASPVNCETGQLQSPIVLNDNGQRKRILTHPETDSPIADVEIPLWDELKSVATDAHHSYPVAKIIGWDAVITDDGPMFLEASGQPGSHMLQLERGLFKDPIIRRVLKNEGVIV